MIEFEEAGKRYGGRGRGVDALAAVTVHVEAGACVAVVGPNGAGKSTLLGLVLGFTSATSGSLAVGGMAPRDWVRRNGAAYLPERFTLPAEWTVRGGLRALARLEGGRDDARRRVDGAIETFGLAPFASKRIGALSRGLLQRVGLAQATLAPRDLVVLDEPTEGLDHEGRLQFRQSLLAMRAAGATILVASHDLAELERVTQRAIVLDSGRVTDVIDNRLPDIADLYSIRVLAPEASITAAFPDAVRMDVTPPDSDATANPDQAGGHGEWWAVRPADAADLNTRLATLIATGALVLEVKPVTPSLGDAVLRAMTGEGRAG